MFLEIKSGKDKDSVWVKAEDISMFECKEATDIPGFSWEVIAHTKDGESYDIHYNFNHDAAIKFANDYITEIM
jgi:hypothetical protein